MIAFRFYTGIPDFLNPYKVPFGTLYVITCKILRRHKNQCSRINKTLCIIQNFQRFKPPGRRIFKPQREGNYAAAFIYHEKQTDRSRFRFSVKPQIQTSPIIGQRKEYRNIPSALPFRPGFHIVFPPAAGAPHKTVRFKIPFSIGICHF